MSEGGGCSQMMKAHVKNIWVMLWEMASFPKSLVGSTLASVKTPPSPVLFLQVVFLLLFYDNRN